MPSGVYIRTKETRRNISISSKGRFLGNKHPMWGKRHSEESIKKMSETHKIQWRDPQYRKKLVEIHIGKHPSKETLEKMSKAQKGRHHSKKSCEKISLHQRGPNGHNWHGGVIFKDGYRFICLPYYQHYRYKGKRICRYVQEHRFIIEHFLGRPLLPKEEAHHINKKRADNHPENLMAFSSQSAHQRFEHNKFVKPEEIIFDGRVYHQG